MSRTPMLTKHGKALFIACLAMIFSQIQTLAQNPVVTENALPGTAASVWDVSGAGDLSIQGYATEFSINTGETVDFKIDVKAPATGYTIQIYRLGYYNNTGARLIADLGNFTGVAQPDPLYEVATGKTDCSNWAVSASWNSAGVLSGLYIARLTRNDNQGASLIPFIVRDDSRASKIIFKTSDATWQAYNGYGGNSLYVNNSGTPVPGFNHATKVSYNRPFFTRNGGGGSGSSEDFLFHAEFPMIRWMERNGYDVSYISDVDMDRDVTPITPSTHKIFLSVGHDEYWSANARLRAEAARNSGTHLAFFSGNEIYWKTRWEDNHRTLVCYKEGTSGENTCGGKCDPLPDVWTGLWRDGCDFPAADGCNPENKLTGQISWIGSTGTIEVPEKFSQLRFWRHTTITSLGSGQTATLANNTLGYEWDPESNNGKYPPGRIKLSQTVLSGQTHHLSLYRHNNGALVFGAGTVQWSWGLDANHDGSSSAEDERMQQATVNLFADMGVLPDNLQSGLTADSPVDITAPVSVITSPVNGASVPAGNPVTISGTASDVNGVVAGIEVSTDGGLTWESATGTTSWTFTWTPAASGTANIQCRAIDDNANMESVSPAPAANSINVTITAAAPLPCPCTIFPPSATPAVLSAQDGQAIELGMKFRSNQDGFITGVRFYKATGDPGTHTGQLWTSSGSLLASVVFTGETASGWQQMDFNAPVAISANTTYVISYHSSANYYTFTDNYFTAAVTNGSLTALANGTDGPNGIYLYTSTPSFPTETYQKSNYWVDVIFNNSVGPDVNPPQVTSVSPVAGATNVSVNSTVQAVFNEPLDGLTIDNTTVELRDGSNTLIPAAITYNSGTRTISITPNTNIAFTTNYTALLKGGISAPHITDVAGNAMTNDYSWSFTTVSEPPPPPAEGPGGPILVISAAANPFSRYAVEILRAEGLNEFTALDISQVNATVLNNYDVVILGEMSLNGSQVAMLTNWVDAGGLFIAFRPDAQLAGLLGITPALGTLSDKYLLVNTASAPGTGITGQTIQFHSAADLYTLNGATTVATLYSNASTATTYPAVTSHAVGTNGGMAFAFTYDLAKSIVYTRQGNPAWAGQERDGHSDNIRSSDMFFPDWIDLDKVAIPQADEQQHLLNNMILAFNRDRRPLPKFWFLPRKLKAAIVMTGDDHGNGGTIARFNQYANYGNNTPADVQDWKAIRGTSYIYTSTPISNAQAAAFEAQGFEIGLHVNTGCTTYTLSSLENTISSQLADFGNKYTSVFTGNKPYALYLVGRLGQQTQSGNCPWHPFKYGLLLLACRMDTGPSGYVYRLRYPMRFCRPGWHHTRQLPGNNTNAG
ncbi:MAG: DUF4082 domain-containing protein [Chitinophagaceae bacterium]|nr:DUF4082 domain-containing protein [Chitinophagaceae bacterium]